MNRIIGKMGFILSSRCHIGIELEADLDRFFADSPPKCILDVGANVGQSAKRFKRAWPTASVYCFEPVPETFARLQVNIRALQNVIPFNCAMGSEPGTAKIYLSGTRSGNSGANTMIKQNNRDADDGITVSTDTLDRFCSEKKISRVDLLKIDVEGFEPKVLEGAQRLLSEKAIRFIYLECVFSPCPEMPHASFFDLHSALSSQGFCMTSFYCESFSLAHGSLMGNALFAMRDHLPTVVAGSVRNIT